MDAILKRGKLSEGHYDKQLICAGKWLGFGKGLCERLGFLQQLSGKLYEMKCSLNGSSPLPAKLLNLSGSFLALPPVMTLLQPVAPAALPHPCQMCPHL